MVLHTRHTPPGRCGYCHGAHRCPLLAVACQADGHTADGPHATLLVEVEEDGQRWRFASCDHPACLGRLESRGFHVETSPLSVLDAEDITGDDISGELVAAVA